VLTPNGNFWIVPLLHSVNDMYIYYEQFLHNPIWWDLQYTWRNIIIPEIH